MSQNKHINERLSAPDDRADRNHEAKKILLYFQNMKTQVFWDGAQRSFQADTCPVRGFEQLDQHQCDFNT